MPTARLKQNATPSELEAAGALNSARYYELTWEIRGTITAADQLRRYIPANSRLVSVHAWRGTEGSGGTSSFDLKNAAGTVLDATIDITAAGGANQRVPGVLETAHADYDAVNMGINVDANTYLYADVTAVEAGTPANLVVQARLQLV